MAKLYGNCYTQDFHTLDLVQYQYGGTNITSVRLYDSELVETMIAGLNKFMKETGDITLNLTALPVSMIGLLLLAYESYQVLSIMEM